MVDNSQQPVNIHMGHKEMGRIKVNPQWLDALLTDEWIMAANMLADIQRKYNVLPDKMRLYVQIAREMNTDLIGLVEAMASGKVEVRINPETPNLILPN